MAKRRMLSMELMRSEEFLALPTESQLLYVHLFLEADDDGFLQGKHRIMKMLDAPAEALQSLIGAGFVLTFPSGAAVIAHWLLCNCIRKDRYTPTRYAKELQTLDFTPGVGYTRRAVNEAQTNSPPAESAVAPPEQTKNASVGALCAEAPGLPLENGREHFVRQSEVEEWKRLYPQVNVLQELRGMRGWLLANPEKKKTAEGIVRFINAWLSKAQHAAPAGAAPNSYVSPRRWENDLPGLPSYDLARAEHKMNTTVPKLHKKQR